MEIFGRAVPEPPRCPDPAPPPSSVVPDAARPVRSVEVPGRRRTRSRSPAAASGLHPMSRVGSAAGGSIWLASGVRRRPGASGTARERPGASWSRRLGQSNAQQRARVAADGVVGNRATRVCGLLLARVVGNHACARYSRMWFRFFVFWSRRWSRRVQIFANRSTIQVPIISSLLSNRSN